MSGSSKAWYGKFLSSLTIPSLIAESSSENVFYVLRVPAIEFKKLNSGHYEIHLLFYDIIRKQFFGKQVKCEAIVRDNSLRIQPEMLFFHTPILDNRIVIICEVVKLDNKPWVYGWTAIPFFIQNHPLTEYNSHASGSSAFSRYKLYCGSCAYLTHFNNLDELDKRLKQVDGIISASFYLYTRLNEAIPFVPEHYFISPADEIPGLQISNDNVIFADTFTTLVDNATLSYHGNGLSVEKTITDMLMHDYCLRLNKPRRDCAAERFSIIERRLKIGVHNGFCYVEEPHFIYLYHRDEVDANRMAFRRRSRSLNRYVGTSLSLEVSEYVARNCVRLTRVCADEFYAIIFSIDFLVGFCDRDYSVKESQWVMIAWNAWCPFHNNAFTIADTITVPLVGGPRPNPDDVFCFKSLMNLQNHQAFQLQRLGSSLFRDGNACFNLKFNFAVVEATNSSLLMTLPDHRHSYTARKTPSPKPDFPPQALLSPSQKRQHYDISQYPSDEAQSVKDLSVVSKTTQEFLAPNIYHDDFAETKLKRTQSVPLMESKVTHQKYVDDFNHETRVSAFPRSVAHYFTRFSFQPIVSAEESQSMSPVFVDPLERRQLSVESEINTSLSTNEIILQFMAIQNISNRYYETRQRNARYFFTFQFYRFGKITTEKLLSSTSGEWKPEMPQVFQRLDDSEAPIREGDHGFTVRFIVYNSAIPLNDADDFARYLIHGHLHIDVWNADSLIHVGACVLPLHVLCRQNSTAVRSDLQCAIVEEGILDGSSPITTGLLYLRVANIGRRSEKMPHSADKFSRICYQNNSERFCQRARPLHAVHDNALQRFLSAQKLDLYQRKEEIFSYDSLRRVERWNEIKKQSSSLINAPMKRFIFREELEAYKTLRSENKASALLRAVFRGITTRYTVHAKYGQVEFFEFLLRNTFAEQILCVIDISDPRLSLVTNTDEWKFYKDTFHLRTPLERDLFSLENERAGDGPPRNVLLLGAMESVCVPFKFDNMRMMDRTHRPADSMLSVSSEIRAIFKRIDTDEPIGILEIVVQNREVAVSRVLRLFCEESRKVSRIFRLRNSRENRNVCACRVSLPSVLCSLRTSNNGAQQEVHIGCNIGSSPDVQTFMLMFYTDCYFARQLAVWKVSIHSMRRLDVQGIQAQLTKIPLPLRSTLAGENSSLLHLFSSSSSITFQPAQTFANDAKLIDDVRALFVPNFTGQRVFVINAVDVQSNRLLLSWIIYATVGEPNIVKVFDVKVPANLDQPISKKIDITNAYDVTKKWRIHTSNTRLVSVAQEFYVIDPHATIQIQFDFYPVIVDTNSTHQVLVFIEDAEIAQQEEAYALRITYFASHN